MRMFVILVVALSLIGCQSQSTVRNDVVRERGETALEPPPSQDDSAKFVIFPKGTKLEPFDYSAVWGVSIRHHDLSESETERPVVISSVHQDLPAGLSGVVEGATILTFNGRQIRNQTDLYNTIRELPLESVNIPFTMRLPSGEIREGTTFVIHVEITGLRHFFERLEARSKK